MEPTDILHLRDDLSLHINRAHADLRSLVAENIETVKQKKPTNGLKEKFFDVNVHLAACLDYIGNHIYKHWCSKNNERAYFLCSNINLKKTSVIERIKKTYPDLDKNNPSLFDFLLRYQPAIHSEGTVLEEFRKMNNTGKHVNLIPPKSFNQLEGITIHRKSGIPNESPLWIWARSASLGPGSHLLGGNNSIIGVGSLTGNENADVLGLRLKDVLNGNESDDVKVYPFLCLWFADGLSRPLLQFAGTVTNMVSDAIMEFLSIEASNVPELTFDPPLIFRQLFVNGNLHNDGKITTLP